MQRFRFLSQKIYVELIPYTFRLRESRKIASGLNNEVSKTIQELPLADLSPPEGPSQSFHSTNSVTALSSGRVLSVRPLFRRVCPRQLVSPAMEPGQQLNPGSSITPAEPSEIWGPFFAPKIRRKVEINQIVVDIPNSSPPPESDDDSITLLPVASDDESTPPPRDENDRRASPLYAGEEEEEECCGHYQGSSSAEEDEVAAALSR
jgi:hypothetical protein